MHDPLKSDKITRIKVHGLSSVTSETVTREEFMRVRPTEVRTFVYISMARVVV